MGKLMFQCPKTRRALFTGRYVDAESFRYSPVFFSRTYCGHCKLTHEWFAKEALAGRHNAGRGVRCSLTVAALPRRSQPYCHPDPELPKHGVRVRPTGPSAYTTICRDPLGKQVWTKVGSTAEMMITEERSCLTLLGRPQC